ncbi:trk system potassium uptake protein [Salmonella enterica subsp. diarizonae]|uniref:Trk system potassium uptake protein n=1 Tax=Salmonella diarizonae TaxID=59204 RepID=A0A379U6L2_SALDZ|nr:trk system potassium uptake protein [Salmonella enterica subsp. diarizonae]
MILPGLVALIYLNGAGRAFTQTFLSRWRSVPCCGGRTAREKGELKSREGFLIVCCSGPCWGSVGALPFIFSESPNLTITDAFLNRSLG